MTSRRPLHPGALLRFQDALQPPLARRVGDAAWEAAQPAFPILVGLPDPGQEVEDQLAGSSLRGRRATTHGTNPAISRSAG
jgi:hypothetical protein